MHAAQLHEENHGQHQRSNLLRDNHTLLRIIHTIDKHQAYVIFIISSIKQKYYYI